MIISAIIQYAKEICKATLSDSMVINNRLYYTAKDDKWVYLKREASDEQETKEKES